MTDIAQKIQALLFTAGESVPKADLAKLLNASADDILAALEEIKVALAGHGLTLLVTEEAAQLTTSPSVAEFLQQFFEAEDTPLSRAASETLALIAYRGPINRYEIEAIRGVDSRRILRQLVQRGVIRRLQAAQRLPRYEVTEEFWQHLGVEGREQLPRFSELKDTEGIARILQSQSGSSI